MDLTDALGGLVLSQGVHPGRALGGGRSSPDSKNSAAPRDPNTFCAPGASSSSSSSSARYPGLSTTEGLAVHGVRAKQVTDSAPGWCQSCRRNAGQPRPHTTWASVWTWPVLIAVHDVSCCSCVTSFIYRRPARERDRARSDNPRAYLAMAVLPGFVSRTKAELAGTRTRVR